MSHCGRYDPDKIFSRFQVIEFPISYVGLQTKQLLDVEINLSKSAYLKTMCEGNLMKFVEAREISASHRSFNMHQINEHTIEITFRPINECISHAKGKQNLDNNRFVFDLRLIKVDGIRCCDNEFHWEVGRFYISGQYEFCQISHFPSQINFGNVVMETKVKKHIRIRNESSLIAAKLEYVRVTGFEVSPHQFMIYPNATQLLSVTLQPTCLKVRDVLTFRLRNPHDSYKSEDEKDEENYITYNITCNAHILCNKRPREVKIESLHKLIDQDVRYAFTNKEELELNKKSKEAANKNLQMFTKNAKKPKRIIERFTTGTLKCLDNNLTTVKPKPPHDFCKKYRERASTYDLLHISFLPFFIDFGRIALNTYGCRDLTLNNNSKYDITINFHNDACVCYTSEKLTQTVITMKAKSTAQITIYCLGFVEGNYKGTFEYFIDNKYSLKHGYTLQVGTPTLMLQEKILKFGMISSDSFITSVPVRIYNYFNIPVKYSWEEVAPDTPFEIIPHDGFIPNDSTKICDVFYNCKPSKTKVYEIDFISKHHVHSQKTIPLELYVMTRKLSIKFMQLAVVFKEIPLNLESVETVKLENGSREMANFYVVEPLIPGVRVEPMSGNIRPKMILSFTIKVKISCVLEFSFDIIVKINNKENVILPISGSVVEPKIMIHPKNINMARIPSNMIAFVPLTIQNFGNLKTTVEVLDTGDDNYFKIYIAQGNEKQRIFELVVEGGQSKTVFIKICDCYRREYEMYLPFRINGLIGPPDQSACSIELQHYIGGFEESYANNPKVKVKSINKDICYSRVSGVITLPWIKFSDDYFEIVYNPDDKNIITFTMTNVSRYYLYITILTGKLAPYFTLNLLSEEEGVIFNDHCIKFEFDRQKEAEFSVKFHPKGYGRFVATAILFLDKHMTIAYSNLTFVGKRLTPIMTPSTPRVIFPPAFVGTVHDRTLTVKIDTITDKDAFSCFSKEEPNLSLKFLTCEHEEGDIYSVLTIEIKVSCNSCYARTLTMAFNHVSGSGCEIEINFCFTYCPLTLHINSLVSTEDNPYPYFPLSSQKELYEYLESSKNFLEKWMFQQGFRRDLYPEIPDTFHAISTSLSSQGGGIKSKGMNVSFLNYMRRIAGPLMKHVRKIPAFDCDESFRNVKEIYDTYKEIINLIRSRGGSLWTLQARFLLSYDQLVVYAEHETSKCNADLILTSELLQDVNAFNRLTKQSWIDVILQSYKVFVIDSCLFDCVCVSNLPRDIVKNILDWYNGHIQIQHNKLRGKDKPIKVMTNITTDLSDGIAIISAFLSYCPYLNDQFSVFCEIDKDHKLSGIINNACLIIEAMNQMRIFFPLNSKDFLQPNFIQMLFLSVHLYVSLPMFTPKDIVRFNPPLLRSSTRHVAVGPASQETLIFSYVIINNESNNFFIEKGPSENGKKMFLVVKYVANFVHEENCTLLVYGYNKTRIFDTFIVFTLQGCVSALNPVRKCKVTGPLYRPNKVDVLVGSPFISEGYFTVYLTDIEPKIPVTFDEIVKPKFYLRRLSLIDLDITLPGMPQESGQDNTDHKLHMQVVCLSTQVGTSWIWFRGEIGEFFVKVTTQPRWDLAIDTLQAKLQTWPVEPCNCGEACECYRTTILMIPHRNELMMKALRYALIENSSESMLNIFDKLIQSSTGRIILGMLLEEGGTNMSDVNHILRSESNFTVYSRSLIPRWTNVKLEHHTDSVLPLPITLPLRENDNKYTVTFTSACGMDIRTYRILFIPDHNDETLTE